MRNVIVIMFFLLGCAKVDLKTSEPLKVDVSMRVDIYQHVVEDIASIEDQIYGGKSTKLNAIFSVNSVYAADFSPFVQEAIERRKERVATIDEYAREGYIGTNRNAYLEIIDTELPGELKIKVQDIVVQENKDRKVIYEATAAKNQADIKEVTKLFFEDHYRRAPSGYWFEMYDSEKQAYAWMQK